jgi:hypothetical protein
VPLVTLKHGFPPEDVELGGSSPETLALMPGAHREVSDEQLEALLKRPGLAARVHVYREPKSAPPPAAEEQQDVVANDDTAASGTDEAHEAPVVEADKPRKSKKKTD